MRLVAAVFALGVLIGADFQAARFIRGDAPPPAPQNVGWEQAVLRAGVSERGVVDWIETLGGTEPLTSVLRGAVQQWHFEPAREGDKAVSSQVLVAAVYRPPTLYDVPAFRGGSTDLAARSDQIPMPASLSAPVLPANALGDGVVVVEVLVGMKGEVRSAAAVQSTASGFNASAVETAMNWRFRPATRQDGAWPAYAYLVFGFRQPVIRTTPVR
jgi:TonB family protein